MSDLHALMPLAEQAWNTGQWDELKKVAAKARALPGGAGYAQHWLAMGALRRGEWDEAARLLRMAVNLTPGDVEMARQLAMLLAGQMKDRQGSVAVLRGAARLHSAHEGLLTQWAEGEFNVGNMAVLPGIYARLAVMPGAEARLLPWLWACMTTLPDAWPAAPVEAGVLKNVEARGQLALWQAIGAWWRRDAAVLDAALAQLRAVTAALAPKEGFALPLHERTRLAAHKSFDGYWRMFSALRDGMPPTVRADLPRLWVVGDSHCLPPHGQVVAVGGVAHRVVSVPVVGLKLWHVAQADETPYRALLKHWLAALPEGEPVVVSAGEIDARVDEGVWLQVKKGRALEEVLEATYGGGVKALAALVREACAGRRVWVMAVPQLSSVNLARVPEVERAGFVAMRAQANAVATDAARAAGLGVVDVWGVTGEASAFLADGNHLVGGALGMGLGKGDS